MALLPMFRPRARGPMLPLAVLLALAACGETPDPSPSTATTTASPPADARPSGTPLTGPGSHGAAPPATGTSASSAPATSGSHATPARAASSADLPPLEWPAAMAAAATRWTEAAALAQGAVRAVPDAPPRTARLLREDVPAGFTALGEPPEPLEPIVVPLSAGPGVKQRDATFVVEPKQLLASAGDLGIASDDVAELLLRVRVRQGTVIEVHFHQRRSDEVPRVAMPVAPSGEWQTLRVSQPLLMAHGGPDLVDRISLSGDKELGETLILQIEPLRIARAGAVYSLGTHGFRSLQAGDGVRPGLWQSTAGELRLPWPDDQVAGRRVTGSVAALPGPADAPASLEVALEDALGQVHVLTRVSVVPGEPWRDVTVDLPQGAIPAALRLRAADLPRGTVLLHAGWRAIDTSRAPRRAVLLVMDTLRADALSSYGHPTWRTPALDALGAEGVRFARCYSQAHWTRPSMPSIMTGLYVPATGVENKFDQLPEAYDTLPERFARAGWRTLAFLANAQAGPASGLGQGHDELVLTLGQDADALFRELVEPRLAALPDDDLLVYVHLMDAHGPYGPEEAPADYAPIAGEPVEPDPKYDRRWTTSPTRESRIHYYGVDVERMDAAIGGFLERVVLPWERAGTPVVVAALSDHGEWLGEDGQWGHGKGLLRPEVVHVPLLLRAPARIAPGTVWEEPVENLDVGATLLDVAGLLVADGGADAGRSLLARLEGRGVEPADRLAIASNVSGPERHLTLYGPRGALVGADDALAGLLEGAGGALREAGDRERALGPTFGALWAAYDAAAAPIRAHHHAQADDSAELDAASLEQLRAMGYLGY